MYDKLVPELRDDPSGVGYAAMSDEQVAQKMLEPAGVEVVSYFAGFRTLAAILTQAEYDYLRSMLDVMATQSRMVADMVRMLEMPGDERGVGGGVDFGHPAVRQFVQSLPENEILTPSVKARILAIAERPIPRWRKIGLDTPPEPGNIASARAMMQE
jgi:hypothetical protein